jgi:hypothetical protein
MTKTNNQYLGGAGSMAYQRHVAAARNGVAWRS